jgi:signal transduction histidine kinase
VDEINTMLKAELSMTDNAMTEFGRSILKVFNWMAVGVLTTDPRGIISTINKRATEMLGKKTGEDLSDIVGHDVFERIASEKQGLSLDVERRGKVFSLDLRRCP